MTNVTFLNNKFIKFVLLKEIGKPMFNQKVDINTIKKSFKCNNRKKKKNISDIMTL